ncbi:hypothetical protein J6590_056896 [Homalodisca vitripennis]|nr:hypothetical protein J6590_056896 [Homalodisca vitripennis]
MVVPFSSPFFIIVKTSIRACLKTFNNAARELIQTTQPSVNFPRLLRENCLRYKDITCTSRIIYSTLLCMALTIFVASAVDGEMKRSDQTTLAVEEHAISARREVRAQLAVAERLALQRCRFIADLTQRAVKQSASPSPPPSCLYTSQSAVVESYSLALSESLSWTQKEMSGRFQTAPVCGLELVDDFQTNTSDRYPRARDLHPVQRQRLTGLQAAFGYV